MTVSPAIVNIQSTNSFSFVFQGPKKTFNTGSGASLTFPAGWSAPQTSNPSGRGFINVTPVLSGSTASLQGITGTGPWTVSIGFSTSQKQGGFNVSYQSAIAPTNGGVYTFTTRIAQSGGSLAVLNSGSPTITVNSLVDSNSTTSITSNLDPSTYGDAVTFTAKVSSAGSRIPSGTVAFMLGDVILGTAALNNQALAILSTNRFSVPDSPDSITAVYSGDSNFNASVSAILSQTVNPAPLTMSGLAVPSRIYDGSTVASLDTSGVVFAGVLAGDNVALDITAASASFSNPNVGLQKPVTVAGLALSGVDSGEYTIVPTASLLADITPAALSVTANDTNRYFGAPNPPFSATYSGFVPGEDSSILSGAPVLSTTATPSSPVAGSPYVISVTSGTLAAANYSFSFYPGQLTVRPGIGQAQKIFSTTIAPVGTVTLLCGGAAGQTYILQASSTLSAGSWIPILTNTTDANGWMTCADPTATNSQIRFYRTSLH